MADLLAYGEDIIGFPGGEATAKVKLMTKLWENPDPTKAMASDTEISINDTNYDLLAYVCFLRSTNNKVIPLVLTPKNKDAYACYADSGNALQRRFDYANGTVTAKTGYIGNTVDNTYIILYQIYGIKLEREIPVVAENVSTMAANCLLSDGETSVEDALTDLSSYSGPGYRVDKIGKMCILTIDGATGTFSVPEAYKPNGVYRDIVASANGEFLGRSVITATREVNFNPTTSSGKYGSIVYFI